MVSRKRNDLDRAGRPLPRHLAGSFRMAGTIPRTAPRARTPPAAPQPGIVAHGRNHPKNGAERWDGQARQVGENDIATVPSPSGPAEMGYISRMRFEPGELALLAETQEIEIETALPGGPAHRTIIWIVVDGGDAFVRSYRGASARWYREAVAYPQVTIHVDGRALPARAVAAVDPASIRRTSDALASKYAASDSTPAMLQPDVLDTTLRLTPR